MLLTRLIFGFSDQAVNMDFSVFFFFFWKNLTLFLKLQKLQHPLMIDFIWKIM